MSQNRFDRSVGDLSPSQRGQKLQDDAIFSSAIYNGTLQLAAAIMNLQKVLRMDKIGLKTPLTADHPSIQRVIKEWSGKRETLIPLRENLAADLFLRLKAVGISDVDNKALRATDLHGLKKGLTEFLTDECGVSNKSFIGNLSDQSLSKLETFLAIFHPVDMIEYAWLSVHHPQDVYYLETGEISSPLSGGKNHHSTGYTPGYYQVLTTILSGDYAPKIEWIGAIGYHITRLNAPNGFRYKDGTYVYEYICSTDAEKHPVTGPHYASMLGIYEAARAHFLANKK
jgi:hypothetical protein